MPVKPLELDDRTFKDLVEEVRSLIPRYAPGWTDHNVSDPGIMVLELFAWVTESMLYRINRVPDASRVRLLELLGAAFRPAQPTMLKLRVSASEWPEGDNSYVLERGTQVWGHSVASGRVPFEVMRTVEFTAGEPVRSVTLRQTQWIDKRKLARPDAGHPYELIPVGEGYLTLPPGPRLRQPGVTVDDEPWEVVSSLRSAPLEKGRRVALKPWLNAVAFGGGLEKVGNQTTNTGDIPRPGATIRVTYHWLPSAREVVTDKFTSTGQPWQVYRLSKPLLLLDLQEPDDLEPLLEVQETEWVRWEYVPTFLDMTEKATQYSFDPWSNSIRCGGGLYGRVADPTAPVQLSGRVTLGSGGNLPREPDFTGWSATSSSPQAQPKARPGLSVETWECLSPGRDPTTLDEARLQVFEMLRPDWRAVTATDFKSVIRRNLPDIARVVCRPGRLPSLQGPPADGETRIQPGRVEVTVIPDRISELIAPSSDLHRILASAPDSRRLVAMSHDGAIALWNMVTGERAKPLEVSGVTGVAFSPDGQRFLTEAPDPRTQATSVTLWNTQAVTWDIQADSLVKDVGSCLLSPRFSPRGRWLVTIQQGGAWLREIEDGAGIHWLPGVASWEHLAFGPGDTSLVATSGGSVQLWDVTGKGKHQELLPLAPAGATSFTAVALSAGGSCAAAADAQGRVHVWQLRAKPVNTGEMSLNAQDPPACLLLDPAGTRLVIQSTRGVASLWSARTGARLADLSADSPLHLLAFSDDGQWLATAHADQVVRIWAAADGGVFYEEAFDAPVCALVFSPSGRRLAAITRSTDKYTLYEWDLRSKHVELVAVRELPGKNPPLVHASGRWLAYYDESLMHIWDIEMSAEVTAVYVDFDDPDVKPDGWALEPVDSVPPVSCGIVAATSASVLLTHSKYLRTVSAEAPGGDAKRSAQHWNAEHVSEAAALLAARRLVTTRSEVAGPTYFDVTVELSVLRRLLTIEPKRLEGEIHHALLEFFDPLHGGPDQTGWPPGRAVYASEVCQVVEAIPGVDHVERVILRSGQSEDLEEISIPPLNLVRATVVVHVR